ncbi:zinc finger CCCH domain-containing protein 11A-like isoform X5 [Pleurodeles waltl]|uniref:zinc finger CCCH domain-containing protein 11A-like isoform X5 n=1 Tax=Pleurodeles waltl TaxID=8319 RepID=UPI00370998DF
MSKAGQDCYFFFYSSCSKGDSCPFRHCEAAIGNETVCTLWQEGRCFRQVCKFRHMEIDKKRSEIPCYWENQLSGCQKANCAFHHTKGRFVDGIFFPPSKTAVSWPEPAVDEVKGIQPSLQQDKLSGLPNTSPQLRGVIKVDHENVPSPTHPPVIINAADDDDDADQFSDHFSEDEVHVQHTRKGVLSPRMRSPSKKGGSINVGIRSMRQSKPKNLTEHANPLGSGTSPSVCTAAVPKQGLPKIEKNIRSVMRTVTLSSNPDEEPRFGLTLSERLEKRKNPFTEALSDEVTGPALKRSLAERLGRKIKSSELSVNEAQKKVHFPRSIKERLGFPSDQSNTETGGKDDKLKVEMSVPAALQASAGGDALQECVELGASDTSPKVLVKSFEEIMREKRRRKQQETAVQLLKEHTQLSVLEGGAPKENFEESLSTSAKDSATTLRMQQVRPQRSLQGKTPNQLPGMQQISSPLQGLQTSPVRSMQPLRTKSRLQVSSPAKSQEPSSPVKLQEQSLLGKSQEPSSSMNFNQPLSPVKTDHPSSLVKPHQPSSLGKSLPDKHKQLSLLVKPQQPSSPVKPIQPSSQLKAQQPLSPMKPQKPSSPVTFQQPSSPVHAHQLSLLVRPQQPSSPVRSPQSTSPTIAQQSCSPVSSSQHLPLVLKDVKGDKPSLPDKLDQRALSVHVEQPSTSLSVQQPSQDESKQSSTVRSKDLSPVRQLETLTGLQETTDVMSSEEGFSSADAPADKAAKSKGKPKASVKPSVGRKQVPVKGPQKRKGGKSKPTAVAAVKPMSPSFPTDEPPAKKAAQAVGDTSDPVTEQEKTTGAGAEASDDSAASLEAMQAVPNPATELASPTPSPASVKTRRSSSSAPKTPLPAEDDFEKLMWELSGGRMEEEAEIDLDAGKDEDDLLLELSEMIDS